MLAAAWPKERIGRRSVRRVASRDGPAEALSREDPYRRQPQRLRRVSRPRRTHCGLPRHVRSEVFVAWRNDEGGRTLLTASYSAPDTVTTFMQLAELHSQTKSIGSLASAPSSLSTRLICSFRPRNSASLRARRRTCSSFTLSPYPHSLVIPQTGQSETAFGSGDAGPRPWLKERLGMDRPDA